MTERPKPCREKKDPWHIFCETCSAWIAMARMYGAASQAKRNHYQKTGHSLDGMTATQDNSKKPKQKVDQFKAK